MWKKDKRNKPEHRKEMKKNARKKKEKEKGSRREYGRCSPKGKKVEEGDKHDVKCITHIPWCNPPSCREMTPYPLTTARTAPGNGMGQPPAGSG